MAELLKLAQNEGLDPTAVEVGARKEINELQDFGVYEEINEKEVKEQGLKVIDSRLVNKEQGTCSSSRLRQCCDVALLCTQRVTDLHVLTTRLAARDGTLLHSERRERRLGHVSWYRLRTGISSCTAWPMATWSLTTPPYGDRRTARTGARRREESAGCTSTATFSGGARERRECSRKSKSGK